MSAIHVVVRPEPARAPSPALAPLYGLFDVVVDGVNITARLGEGQAFAFLAELGHAVAGLTAGVRGRAAVQLYADTAAWELGLERDADELLLTVYRAGAEPEVAVHERRVSLAALRDALLGALAETSAAKTPAPVRGALVAAQRALTRHWPAAPRPSLARAPTEIAPRAVGSLSFQATLPLRAAQEAAPASQVERSDLHALLGRGEIRLGVRGRQLSFTSYPFLLAERLLLLAEEVVDASRAGRHVFRRVELEGLRLAVRRGPRDESILFAVGPATGGEGGATFPEIPPQVFVQACARFATALATAIGRKDAEQSKNLRLVALSALAQNLAEQAEDEDAEAGAVQNPAPETYRTFALPSRRATAKGVWEHGGKMRFVPKWVATVPGIDLKATFLCGERLVIGAAREMACLARGTGNVLWRVATPRAGAVVTPAGLVRIQPDGKVLLHDLETGDVRFSRRLTPRAAGGACGAVVHAPGLPKLIVLAEGDRKVTAIDLVSGDVRWRHTGRRPAAYRIRRAGRLVLVAGGDSALLALDASSGEMVWRMKDRLPFTGDVIVDHDAAFAVNASPQGGARLHCLDPWSGAVRWSAELDERPVPGQPPLVTPEVIALPVRDRRGLGAAAFSRATGEPLWQHEPGLIESTTAWLAIDDAIVANSGSGTLLSIEAASGALRYNHVFSRHVDADQPRRLEPVLRSGALFVPQHQVHVVRPRDGEIIGTVPTDLIPDLLRVDERCDVYVAEESGHVAAFGVATRLSLVK